MDYYQELGLEPTATVPEIRRAYKMLARLVHPDGQTDPGLREMAQRQMQRLNQMLAILTDRQARREYDAWLAVGGMPEGYLDSRGRAVLPPPASLWRLPAWAVATAHNWFWVLLALVLAGVAIWYAAQGHPPAAANPAVMTFARFAKTSAPDQSAHLARSAPAKAAAVRKSPDKTSRKTPPADPGDPQDHAAPASLPEPAVEVRATAPPESPADPPPIPSNVAPTHRSSAETTFAGVWLAAPDPDEKPLPGSYPAIYVELLLADERGELTGSYRAEYKVPDRAVSPGVWFQVHGARPEGTAAKLRWNSRDGAKGEMEIALEGPNLIALSWWSTQLGRHPGLASGTSRLIRQQAR